MATDQIWTLRHEGRTHRVEASGSARHHVRWYVDDDLLAEKRDVRREISLEQIGRRLEQSTARLESLLAEPGDSPSGHAQRNEQEILLADALAELPGDYREVILLRHIEGLPFEEVARRMDRSCGAVPKAGPTPL